MPIVKHPLPVFTGPISQPDPIWATPAGIVSAVDPDTTISTQLVATDPFNGSIVYTLKSGLLPGLQDSFGSMIFLLHADEPESSVMSINSVTSFGVPLLETMTITNTESKFGIGSIDNQNKEGYINFGSPAALGIITGDFSIHGWFNRKANPPGIYELFSNQEKPSNRIAIKVYLDNTSTPVFQLVSSLNTNYIITSMQAMPLNIWIHIALVKSANTMYAFINGVLQGTQTMNSNSLRADANGNLFLCASGELGKPVGSLNANRFNGRIDEFVIEHGARWTTSFPPPTVQFEPIPVAGSIADPFIADVRLSLSLEGPSNTSTFVDDSILALTPNIGLNSHINNSLFKYGTSSMEVLNDLNSSIIYNHVDLNPVSASSMTLEAWIYIKSWTDWRTVFDGSGTTVYVNSTGNYRWWWGFSVIETTNVPVTLNTWHHVAVVKENLTVTKLYHNGINILTNSGSGLNGNTLEIGSAVNRALYPWDGYIDDVRYTRNVARYTSDFIPPGPINSTQALIPSLPGVKLGNDGTLSGNVGSYLGTLGSDLYDFTVTATSNFTRISTDRNFNIAVFDIALNTSWESLWAGSSTQHNIGSPTLAQFESSTPNNVWLSWPTP